MMHGIRWPLQENVILRRDLIGTFGMVRTNNTVPHHGWDLFAFDGTPCYAVGDCEVLLAMHHNKLGNFLDIKLDLKFDGKDVFVRYAHLTSFAPGLKIHDRLRKGQLIGYTGSTGEGAKTMTGIDKHLHIEFLANNSPATGKAGLALSERFDPKDIYGFLPLGAGKKVYDPICGVLR